MRPLLAVGLVLLLSAAGPARGRAQAPREAILHSLSAYDILYVISGGGSNTLALMRDDGVVLIDTLPTGWGAATLAAIESVSDQPVTTIVNTHVDEAHAAANAEFPAVTRIVAHANTRDRMAKMAAFQGANAKFLPSTIVTDKLSLLDGPDRLELYYFGAGHTDGDLAAVFPEKRVAYFGDLFPSKAGPLVDTARGGSESELPRTLGRIAATIANVRTVVPGRETPRVGEVGANKPGAIMPMTLTSTWKDFQEFVARHGRL